MNQKLETPFVALSKAELNTLSKEVFGTSSKWRKLMDQGILNPEVKNVVIPNKETGKLEPKQFQTGKLTIYRYTLQQVQELMLNIKKSKPAPTIPDAQAEPGQKMLMKGVEFEVKDLEFSK